MKKQFFKVKQLADQTVGRAEKSEVLSEDLILVEKRVDFIKSCCNSTSKRLYSCLNGHGADLEKRLKKTPEMSLASNMLESSYVLGENSPLGLILRLCSEAFSHTSKEHLQYEMNVESQVLTPTYDIINKHIPIINKLRKQLNRLTLEMDASKSRYFENVRRSCSSTSDIQVNHHKSENLKDEFEDASSKLETCRDLYATELFGFLSKEAEISQNFLKILEVKLEYHKTVVKILESLLPKAREHIDTSNSHPIFGVSLQESVKNRQSQISPVIKMCVCKLLENGLDEMGLFRIAGSFSKIKKLKSALNSSSFMDLSEEMVDPHVIAGTLKMYLRELPEPLLSSLPLEEWQSIICDSSSEPNSPSYQDKISECVNLLKTLPLIVYENLKYLLKFLKVVSHHSDKNLMPVFNLAIVIGPNLFWKPSDLDLNLVATNLQNKVTEFLITNADSIFTEEVNFTDSEFTCFNEKRSKEADTDAANMSFPSPETEENFSKHKSFSSDPLSELALPLKSPKNRDEFTQSLFLKKSDMLKSKKVPVVKPTLSLGSSQKHCERPKQSPPSVPKWRKAPSFPFSAIVNPSIKTAAVISHHDFPAKSNNNNNSSLLALPLNSISSSSSSTSENLEPCTFSIDSGGTNTTSCSNPAKNKGSEGDNVSTKDRIKEKQATSHPQNPKPKLPRNKPKLFSTSSSSGSEKSNSTISKLLPLTSDLMTTYEKGFPLGSSTMEGEGTKLEKAMIIVSNTEDDGGGDSKRDKSRNPPYFNTRGKGKNNKKDYLNIITSGLNFKHSLLSPKASGKKSPHFANSSFKVSSSTINKMHDPELTASSFSIHHKRSNSFEDSIISKSTYLQPF